MPSDSMQILADLGKEVSFRVGGVKNPRVLFPAKKAVDVRWDVVMLIFPWYWFYGCNIAFIHLKWQKTQTSFQHMQIMNCLRRSQFTTMPSPNSVVANHSRGAAVAAYASTPSH